MLLPLLKNSLPPLHTHTVAWRVIVTCRRSLHAVATHNLNSRHAPAHALTSAQLHRDITSFDNKTVCLIEFRVAVAAFALTGAHSRFVRSPCCCIVNRHNALILAVRAAHCFARNTSSNDARPIPGGKRVARNTSSNDARPIPGGKRVVVKRWVVPSPGNHCLRFRECAGAEGEEHVHLEERAQIVVGVSLHFADVDVLVARAIGAAACWLCCCPLIARIMYLMPCCRSLPEPRRACYHS